MTSKEKLYYLLEQYYLCKYSTEMFADKFTVTFNLETDYDSLSEEEMELFEELSIKTARFSTDEEDLKIPYVYFSEKDVKENATELYLKLKK